MQRNIMTMITAFVLAGTVNGDSFSIRRVSAEEKKQGTQGSGGQTGGQSGGGQKGSGDKAGSSGSSGGGCTGTPGGTGNPKY